MKNHPKDSLLINICTGCFKLLLLSVMLFCLLSFSSTADAWSLWGGKAKSESSSAVEKPVSNGTNAGSSADLDTELKALDTDPPKKSWLQRLGIAPARSEMKQANQRKSDAVKSGSEDNSQKKTGLQPFWVKKKHTNEADPPVKTATANTNTPAYPIIPTSQDNGVNQNNGASQAEQTNSVGNQNVPYPYPEDTMTNEPPVPTANTAYNTVNTAPDTASENPYARTAAPAATQSPAPAKSDSFMPPELSLPAEASGFHTVAANNPVTPYEPITPEAPAAPVVQTAPTAPATGSLVITEAPQSTPTPQTCTVSISGPDQPVSLANEATYQLELVCPGTQAGQVNVVVFFSEKFEPTAGAGAAFKYEPGLLLFEGIQTGASNAPIILGFKAKAAVEGKSQILVQVRNVKGDVLTSSQMETSFVNATVIRP